MIFFKYLAIESINMFSMAQKISANVDIFTKQSGQLD